MKSEYEKSGEQTSQQENASKNDLDYKKESDVKEQELGDSGQISETLTHKSRDSYREEASKEVKKHSKRISQKLPKECNNSRVSLGSQSTITVNQGSALNFCDQSTGNKNINHSGTSGGHSFNKEKVNQSKIDLTRKSLELTKITNDSQIGEFVLEERDPIGLLQNEYSSILPVSLDQIKVEVEEEHDMIRVLNLKSPKIQSESTALNASQAKETSYEDPPYERFGSEIQKLQLELLVKSSMECESEEPDVEEFHQD